MKIARQSFSTEQTEKIASSLGRIVAGGDVYALSGELGAGKTCFVRGLARGMGIDPKTVPSPTYVIVQEYRPNDRGLHLIHIDAYRIGSEEELYGIGWEELIAQEDAVLAIEWPERLSDALPALRTVRIDLDHVGEDERDITFDVPPSRAGRLKSLQPRTKPCPACGENVTIDRPDFPFCSERCRLADLGDWFNENYRISRKVESSDELTD